MFFPSRYAEWLSMEAKKFSTTLCCARRRDIYTKQVTAVCPYEYKISQWAIFMENVYSSARHDLFEKKIDLFLRGISCGVRSARGVQLDYDPSVFVK